MKKFLILFIILFSVLDLQCAKVKRVEPLNWWVGMKNSDLQLLVYGDDLSGLTPEKISYPGVTLVSTERVENKNYVFLNLTISPETKAGAFDIKLTRNGKIEEVIKYELKSRASNSADRLGFNSGDIIYQIFPDRFSNGNVQNDFVTGYPDSTNRLNPNARHGGDIQGIINHLDYISAMGYTAIWVTPVLESNMHSGSYHGYAITDYYKIDPRFGSNQLYRQLSDECKKRGIKLIIDVVLNHSGTEWWLFKDIPSNDWVNNYPDFKMCNFKATTNFDPHRADVDQKGMADGWFARSMPDLNQRNPLLANYLIQNTIWWIEYAGLGGIRSDTHQFPDKYFISQWAKRILAEYPNFNMVGEVWLESPAMVAYWQKDAPNLDGFNSNLPTVMDFPLTFALPQVFSDENDPTNNLNKLYDHFSQDFLFRDPMNMMIFADNHDMARFYTQINENLSNYKLSMALLLTTRGIPQVYAGSEFLMLGDKKFGDGAMRIDFPGGWAVDNVNAFTQQGLGNDQIDAQNYLKRIQTWRKTNDAVKYGQLKHFYPQNGVYVYFRQSGGQSVMVLLNNSKESKTIETNRFAECLGDRSSGIDVISGATISLLNKIDIQGKTAMIIELK
ncbi:MAG: glycoside hydrolase family 13 protein [Bacteroidales bacterium]